MCQMKAFWCFCLSFAKRIAVYFSKRSCVSAFIWLVHSLKNGKPLPSRAHRPIFGTSSFKSVNDKFQRFNRN